MKIIFEFRELNHDEKIEIGDLHSLNGAALATIKSQETLGKTPVNFSKERKWFRLIGQEKMLDKNE